MGNNLCATWQKGFGVAGGNDWHPSKGVHLIRLWAEIFEVKSENNEVFWGRVSDDVVPLNVVCVCDSPETVFQITAYNRLVEKIFDVYLIQPGTRIISGSDRFLHWKDERTNHEWGLNFTQPGDARAFRECCTTGPLSTLALNNASVLSSSAVPSPRHFPRNLEERCIVGNPDSPNRIRRTPSQNAQQIPVQVRQVLSVYVDNRCRCGASCQFAPSTAFDQNATPPPGGQHFPCVGTDCRGVTEGGMQCCVRHCGVVRPGCDRAVYGRTDVATFDVAHTQTFLSSQHALLSSQHALPSSLHAPPSPQHSSSLSYHRGLPSSQHTLTSSQHASLSYHHALPSSQHALTSSQHASLSSQHASSFRYCDHAIDDNVINQTIYVTAKEAEKQILEKSVRKSLICDLPQRRSSENLAGGTVPPSRISLLPVQTGAVLQQSTLVSESRNRTEQVPPGGAGKQTDDDDEVWQKRQSTSIESKNEAGQQIESRERGGTVTQAVFDDVWQRRQSSVATIAWPAPPPLEPSSSDTTVAAATEVAKETDGSFDSAALRQMLRSLAAAPPSTAPQTSAEPEETASKRGTVVAERSTDNNGDVGRKKTFLPSTGSAFRNVGSTVSTSTAVSAVEGNPAVVASTASPIGGEAAEDDYARIAENRAAATSAFRKNRDSTENERASTPSSKRPSDTKVDSPWDVSGRKKKEETDGDDVIPGNDIINEHDRTDSGSWPETVEVRRFTNSDMSGSEYGSEAEGEDGNESSGSIHTMPSWASFASKSTVVRRVGWLTVKNWLVQRKRKIELASKRTWKKYWICLKGNFLLLYACDGENAISEDAVPRYKLVIESGLAQTAPEHPKKENVFSLSTAFGDAYLFQSSSQVDVENWINAIHSACSASLARKHGRENTVNLLQNEIQRIETSIDLDVKMRKMATMHQMTVADARNRQAIERQLMQWEENLEKLYIDHYRLRCYVASLQGSELPNPKAVLGQVSRHTKAHLGRIGAFTVSAFHAYVCARSPLPGTSAVLNAPKAFSPLSTFKSDTTGNQLIGTRAGSARTLNYPTSRTNGRLEAKTNGRNLPSAATTDSLARSFVRVKLPNGQSETNVEVNSLTTIHDVVESVCNKNRLNAKDHFIKMNLTQAAAGFKIPGKNALICQEEFEDLELHLKPMYQVELNRTGKDFGFRVEAELVDDAEREDELCLFVTEVAHGGAASRKGVMAGDEILVLNGKVVAELDMAYIEKVLDECHVICMTLHSCHLDCHPAPPTSIPASSKPTVGSYIDDLRCPPPPTQAHITDQLIGDLIVPAPNVVNMKEIPDLLRTKNVTNDNEVSTEQIDGLLQSVTQVMHICRRQYSFGSAENCQPNEISCLSNKPLSNSQRICKVVLELIETERIYVRDLICLIERYLEPLKDETFLTSDDIEQLFGNIQEIVQFQKLFLNSMEEAVQADSNFNCYHDNDGDGDRLTDQGLGKVLLLIGNSFLYYAHHFKLYSSFCASRSKAQKMILSEDNGALQAFLQARNPKKQHSATLESYLIKPIQRILKYPLMLKQLNELTEPNSQQHNHLKDALRAMEAVAEHINEMQKIYEEYGSVFEDLATTQKQEHIYNRNIDLSVGELQMYGTVNWINTADELGKHKKSNDLLTLVFIFKSAVVVLAQERTKIKKKTKVGPLRPSWSAESSESTRFKLAIPIGELQVRTIVGDASDCHGIWEIVYCRSEKEGRPKKVYQFVSSIKARNDFIRTIHHVLHEAMRRNSISSSKSHTSRSQPLRLTHFENVEARSSPQTARENVTPSVQY